MLLKKIPRLRSWSTKFFRSFEPFLRGCQRKTKRMQRSRAGVARCIGGAAAGHNHAYYRRP